MPLQGKLLLISVYLPDINDTYNLYYELHTVISVCVCESLSHVRLFMTPSTVVYQAPLFLRFPRQEYWYG